MWASDIYLVLGGVTSDTVLNVMRGIGYGKDKNEEIAEKNCVARSETKAADISKHMTLIKDTVVKLEAIEDNNKRVEALGKLTQIIMAAILVMYGNTVIVQTHKDIFRLDYIVALNASGVLKNGTVVGVLRAFESKIQKTMILKCII